MDLNINNLVVSFTDLPTPVLDIKQLCIHHKELVAITGPSGSGKTTLVNAITALDHVGSGQVIWDKTDIRTLSPSERDAWRAKHLGLVMQDFYLFPGLSAIENVLLPQRFQYWHVPKNLCEYAHELLERVGLSRPKQSIDTMSRGEKQRVAIARALLAKPQVIVADEPTASLDAQNGAQIAQLLVEIAQEQSITLIAITHDNQLSGYLNRHLRMSQGRLSPDDTVYTE